MCSSKVRAITLLSRYRCRRRPRRRRPCAPHGDVRANVNSEVDFGQRSFNARWLGCDVPDRLTFGVPAHGESGAPLTVAFFRYTPWDARNAIRATMVPEVSAPWPD